jgi:hypothetical protein
VVTKGSGRGAGSVADVSNIEHSDVPRNTPNKRGLVVYVVVYAQQFVV